MVLKVLLVRLLMNSCVPQDEPNTPDQTDPSDNMDTWSASPPLCALISRDPP